MNTCDPLMQIESFSIALKLFSASWTFLESFTSMHLAVFLANSVSRISSSLACMLMISILVSVLNPKLQSSTWILMESSFYGTLF